MRRQLSAFVSVLRGTPRDVPDRVVARVSQVTIVAATTVANVLGAALAVLLLFFVLPVPEEAEASTSAGTVVAVASYVAFALAFGVWRGLRIGTRAAGWLLEERQPTSRERRASLAIPARIFRLQLALWLAAAVLFAATVGSTSALFAFEVGITVAMSGLATATIAFLLAVRYGRALAARALADEPPREVRVLGVRVRALLVWAIGTGIPIAGTLLIGSFALGLDDIDKTELARAVVVLSAVALGVGLLATSIFSRSLSDPLTALRAALRRVEDGDLDVRVTVNDATEVGYLQAGFNDMVEGLRERERVRDIFGRHVGEDVARRALEHGAGLGGEEREAAALFVDVIGSTRLAAQRSPTDVVALLNAFFDVVVDVVRAHGGFVNKFEGDGALCVFGAPIADDDAADAALAAAREMKERLAADVPELRAAVGVSAGVVVAGNVGARDRFEYTVIGDPVNEAARLSELAKDRPGAVCASGAALARASEEERARWTEADEVVLRGRSAPTQVAVPVSLP